MTTNVDVVRRFYDEIWNEGNLDAIPDVCHHRMTFRGSLGDTKIGHDGFAEYVTSVRGALADYRCHIEELVAEDDRVFAKMKVVGMHTGEFLGFAPTGNTVEWAGAALFRIESRLIEDIWVLGDLHGLIEKLSSDRE